ncbi:MAG TPA: hypothetical protein VM784_14250 [Actinomycetota bacterium]|nr:hypothetical protein [Actinomycetota bacterium]
MELLRDEIRELVEKTHENVLSVYIATDPKAYEPQANSLHFRAALDEAESLLEQHGLRTGETNEFLGPLRSLLDDASFWLHQNRGLAVFRTASQTEVVKLPFEPAPATRWGEAPYVVPLFSHTVMHPRHALLALSQDQVRLFSISGSMIEERELDDLDFPRNLAEALRYDDLQKPELQHHPVTGQGRGSVGSAVMGEGPNERQGAFHGHGESGEGKKTQIEGFLRQVDKGIAPALRGLGLPPLILAGVDYVCAIYRNVTDYPDVVNETVSGNPDGWRPEELLERAAPLLEARRAEMIAQVGSRFEERRAHGLASDSIEDVIDAADIGRVETLIVCEGEHLWGRFDAEDRGVHVEDPPGDGAVDLVDLAARRALATDAAVHLLRREDMPDTSSPVCAVFRY